ncbi:unnamed protein product, partial [Polarella glacialis]
SCTAWYTQSLLGSILCFSLIANVPAESKLPLLLDRFEELFHPLARQQLKDPDIFPPKLHVLSLTSAGFEHCRTEGYIHQLDTSGVEGLQEYARLVGNASEADFVLVPHCFGNIVSHEFSRTKDWIGSRKLVGRRAKAWAGQLRQAGDKALVILTFLTSRLMFPHFADIPHVVSFTGSSDWMARHLQGFGDDELAPPWPCQKARSSGASGRAPFYYPDCWPQDVVVTLPATPPFDFATHWRPSEGRDLLAVFMGQRTSCTRVALLRLWNKTRHADVYVQESSPANFSYSAMLHRAKYCLVPEGHVPVTYRLLDVLSHGCVPVIISSSFHPPFHRLLRWGEGTFPALFLHPSKLRKLRSMLLAEEPEVYRKQQESTFPLAILLHPVTNFFFEGILAELALAKFRGESSRTQNCGARN